MTPKTRTHRSTYAFFVLSLICGAMLFLKMARASGGTPGRQKIDVRLVFMRTAGAVPTGLGIAVPFTGRMAILSRAFVIFTGLGNLAA